eukprot:SAG31_NODE_596_length_13674_cov_3.806409_3_plen_95_part_00
MCCKMHIRISINHILIVANLGSYSLIGSIGPRCSGSIWFLRPQATCNCNATKEQAALFSTRGTASFVVRNHGTGGYRAAFFLFVTTAVPYLARY